MDRPWLTTPRAGAPPRGRRVSAHLAATAVAVVLVSVAVGSFAGVRAFDRGERDVRARANYFAAAGAQAVAESYDLGRAQVSTLAANPQVPALLDDPASCQLSFDLSPFPGSRLDVVGTDGNVVCSSIPLDGVRASHATAPWFATLTPADRDRRLGIFRDARTNHPAAGAVGVIPAADGSIAGAVVLVIPVAGIASELTNSYAGPEGFEFAIVDTRSGSVLSSSSRSLLDTSGDGPHLRKNGLLTGSRVARGTTWRVVAGRPTGPALAAVRSDVRSGALVVFAMLLTLLAALAVAGRRIARPLRQLADAVSRDDPYVGGPLCPPRGPREIRELASRFDQALAAHADYEAELSHQALHDPLTALPNRALLADRLHQALRQSERTGESVCVVFLDLDHFKLINDSVGHATGDRVLVAVAERLASTLRSGDTLARFGGDEFVLIGRGVEPGESDAFAERALRALDAPIGVGDSVIRVTASAGVAVGGPASDGEALLGDADAAMYLAKERGRSRRETFNEDLRASARSRLTIETELRVALERGELHLAYQPKVELETGAIVGFESLVRWDHPALGSVSPATFIPIAEDTGLIVPIGRFVLQETCRQATAWRDAGFDLDVSLNVSGRQLADGTLLDDILASLDQNDLEPQRLCLELTESVLMHDTRRTATILDDLHTVGVKLSIDDFGTGYSSLAYIHRFPVDELKIDRSFVENLPDDTRQQSLVTAVVAMANALGLRIVAEGVETERQRRTLLQHGCSVAQGYLFARPQPANAFGELLRRSASRRSLAQT